MLNKSLFFTKIAVEIGAVSLLLIAGSAYAAPTLSQSAITVGLGQSATVYSQGSSQGVYMEASTNSSIASIQTSGAQLTIIAYQVGSTVATICYVGTASDCANLTINAQLGNTVSFNQNNLTLTVGQNSTVTVSGGNGTYAITGNSSPSIASATLSSTTITLSGLANGSTNIMVCDGANSCNTLIVTTGNIAAGNSTTTSSGALSFSNSTVTMQIGQISTITVSGGSGYFVTGNANPSVASQSISGNTLTISALQNGVTSMTVCSTSNGCGTVSVTVGATTGSGTSGQPPVSFGVTNPTFAVGQNMSISLSGGTAYYISSNASPAIAQASINNNMVSLYGASVGSDSITVCASRATCNTLSATVTGQSVAPTPTSPASGSAGAGPTPVVTGTTSPSTLLAAIQALQVQLAQVLTQVQSIAATLTQLASSVRGSAVTSVPNTGAGSVSAATHSFTQFLSAGSQNAEVSALQKYLSDKGFYSGPITGYYGTLTELAVRAYQKAHSLPVAGYVGPSTRDALNAGG